MNPLSNAWLTQYSVTVPGRAGTIPSSVLPSSFCQSLLHMKLKNNSAAPLFLPAAVRPAHLAMADGGMSVNTSGFKPPSLM